MTTKTHISSTTRVRGSITGSADLTLDGQVEGDIRLDGDLNVDPAARVDGNINADTVVIHGTVKGNIDASVHLTVSKTARIKGAITAPVLRFEDGALISGELAIGASSSSTRNASNTSGRRASKPSQTTRGDDESQLPEGVVPRKVKVKR